MELYGGEKKFHQHRFKEKILTQIKSSITTAPALKVKWLKDNHQNRAFSLDVTAAILVFQTNPVRVELFSYVNALLFQICQSY